MYESHFETIAPTHTKYEGFIIAKGNLYIYQDGVNIQTHRGWGIFRGAKYLGFRFTQKAAKNFIDYELSTYA